MKISFNLFGPEITLLLRVNLKVKVNFTPEWATKAQVGVKAYLYSFFNLGARWGGWLTPRPGRFNPGKDPVPIV